MIEKGEAVVGGLWGGVEGQTPIPPRGVPCPGDRSPRRCGCPPTVGDRRCRTGNHCSHAGDVPVTEAPLKSKQMEVINMRLDFMSMVLAVLARSLPPREAAHAVQVIGERVVEQLGRDPVSESAEEAVAADLAPIIAALQQR